jgi:toxin ParE1/3/4
MKTIIKSPQYEQDITAIWVQIAQHNAEAAERVVMAIEDRIDMLASFPRLGTPCPHLAPGLRRTQWRSYLIYYRLRNDMVEVVRALCGRREITAKSFD